MIGTDRLEALEIDWGWFMALGAALLMLGMISIGLVWLTTIASVLIYGAIMFVGGVVQIVHAFSSKGWKGFALNLAVGVLYLIGGGLLIAHPIIGAIALTLVL